MAVTDITEVIIWEDCDACCLARLTLNGSNITRAVITSITRRIFDLDGGTPTVAIDETVLTVASVVFDTLQTDGRWTKDETGYNFRDTIGGAIFSTANHNYLVEYKIVGANGELAAIAFRLPTQSLFSS